MVIYGKQTVLHVVEHFPHLIEVLYLAKDVDKKLYNTLMSHEFEVKRTKVEYAQKLVKSANHQGFLAQVKPFECALLESIKPLERVVVLVGLTDMGNIGAIIRSAYALGVQALIIGGISNVAFDALARTSSGALFGMPIIHAPNVNDIPNVLKQFGFMLYGATMKGENIHTVQAAPKWALFMGSEDQGLSAKLEKKLDTCVSITMEHDFDSLNVSVAAAILIDRMR